MKRFTDTQKWHDPWFADLTAGQKLLWLYMCDNCDNSGVIDLSFKIAGFLIDGGGDIASDLKALESRVQLLQNGKYFIPSFVEFQFGKLSEKSNLHKNVIQMLQKNNIKFKGSGTLHEGLMKGTGKGKGKGIVKAKEKEAEIFDCARVVYPGTKGGLMEEFTRFKKHNDWREVLPFLKPAIQSQILYRDQAKKLKQFVPEWKHFKTWINNRCWTEEQPKLDDPKEERERKKRRCDIAGCDKVATLVIDGLKSRCPEHRKD